MCLRVEEVWWQSRWDHFCEDTVRVIVLCVFFAGVSVFYVCVWLISLYLCPKSLSCSLHAVSLTVCVTNCVDVNLSTDSGECTVEKAWWSFNEKITSVCTGSELSLTLRLREGKRLFLSYDCIWFEVALYETPYWDWGIEGTRQDARYVKLYIYLYINICICIYIYLNICIRIRIYVYTCICIYIYMYMYICVYVYIYIHIASRSPALWHV